MDNISAKVALRQLIQNEGVDIFQNGKQCLFILKDLAPKDKEGLENIQIAFDKNLQVMLIEAHFKSTVEKQNSINTMYNKLIERLNDQTARNICDIFIYALTWNVSVKTTSPTVPAQQNPPVYTQLKQTQYQYPPQPPRKSSKTVRFSKLLLLGGCALVVIIGSVALLMKGNSKSSIDKIIEGIEPVSTILSIDSIPESTEPVSTILSIDSIPESTTSVDKIDIQQISDKITSEKEKKTYEFTSTEAGRYRFELSDVPNNIYFRMYLYNADMEQLVYDYNKTNGRGITCDLDANSQYYIAIEQQDNVGSYTLNIGRQKECNDISDYEKLSDSTQFTDQRNIYSFSPTESGNYSFILSNVSNNVYYRMYLYNADMEQLIYDYNKTNDRGISQELKSDEKYYIVIAQQDGVGKYIMNYGITNE